MLDNPRETLSRNLVLSWRKPLERLGPITQIQSVFSIQALQHLKQISQGQERELGREQSMMESMQYRDITLTTSVTVTIMIA